VSAVSSVQAGLAGDTVWLRVAGRGTFQNSGGLKNFAEEMVRRGHRQFIVDLADCELMDSTFMGTLVGVGMKVRPEGSLSVIRPNPRNREVLRNLGLDRILRLEEQAPAAPAAATDTVPAAAAARETILEAHENLAAVSPENAVRFKDVLEFLQQPEERPQARP
jgi:anti-sigma B factor antagonist